MKVCNQQSVEAELWEIEIRCYYWIMKRWKYITFFYDLYNNITAAYIF